MANKNKKEKTAVRMWKRQQCGAEVGGVGGASDLFANIVFSSI
jgi:hypothetical protein